MAVTNAELIVDFPEFANTTDYPAALINQWLSIAYVFVTGSSLQGAQRWGSQTYTSANNQTLTMADLAAMLLACHNMTMERNAKRNAARGATPGVMKGPLSGESVNGVSASFDTSRTGYEGYGSWNMTEYGVRLAEMCEMFGAGPIQVWC